MTKLKTTGMSVIDGVEVDITVKGDGDVAEKTMMDLKERCAIIAAAYDAETPPSDLEDIPSAYKPPISVAWDRVFEDEGDGR